MTETVLQNETVTPMSTAAEPARPIDSAIGRLAVAISDDNLGTGGIAELRRSLHQEIPSPTFWRLLTQHVEGAGVTIHRDEELDWALIMGGMATMAPRHHGPTSFGRALARTEFSEARLRTLLATDPGTTAFRDSLHAAITWLDRKSEPMDWRDVARLVLWKNPDRAAKHRRKIARDYYSAPQDDV